MVLPQNSQPHFAPHPLDLHDVRVQQQPERAQTADDFDLAIH